MCGLEKLIRETEEKQDGNINDKDVFFFDDNSDSKNLTKLT